ncbi:MAG: tyrosine--tRNA ligase [Nitrospirae bacterium]|nr:MAG: tyrosine--tRNA ligase [Nitrospirota bacterium]
MRQLEGFDPEVVAEAERQAAVVARGTAEILPEGELVVRLAQAIAERRPLRVKAGFDPTAPDLHLGHTVLLQKLKHFQELGHQVIFLIGDFTAAIGDPTGKQETRPVLSPEQIEANAATYLEQVYLVLDPERTEVRRNSEWFGAMDAADMIRLAAKGTVARLLERDDFTKRMAAGRAIGVHELLYPLIQGYDSVRLAADVEVGGTDQKFNLLMGRELQREAGQAQQIVVMLPILEGLDGVQKMSKSLGNYIGLREPPKEIFGKTMSISDELMLRYYELVSDLDAEGLARLRAGLAAGSADPMEAKKALAFELVARFHGREAAEAARAAFEREVQGRAVPEEVPEVEVALEGESEWLPGVLVKAGLVRSSSEAIRLMRQGAVRVEGERITDKDHQVRPGAPLLVRVGKRRYARIHPRT